LHTRSPRQRAGWKITVVNQRQMAELLRVQPDVTLAEIKRRLRLNCTVAAVGYVLQRLGYTRKKTLCAQEQRRAAVARQRAEWAR
jgi:hypothetical protein